LTSVENLQEAPRKPPGSPQETSGNLRKPPGNPNEIPRKPPRKPPGSPGRLGIFRLLS